MEHIVLYSKDAQPILHIPIDRHGRPIRIEAASATYTIVDLREGRTSSGREIVAETMPTLGTETDQTVSDAGRSQAYPKRIEPADVSGFVEGRRYLISDVAGQEMFTLAKSDGRYLYATKPLQRDYCVPATVEAIELEGSFPAIEANDENETVEDRGGPYQVTWSYAIDNKEYLVPEVIWVRRYSVTPWITHEDILRGHGKLAQRVDNATIDDAIVISTEEVSAELEAGGLDPSEYRTSTVGRIAVRYRALEYIFMAFHGEIDERLAVDYGNRYRAHMAQILTHGPKKSMVVRDDVDQPDHVEVARNKLFVRP